MQECMVMAMETAVQFYDLEGKVRQRHADVQRFAGTGVFECLDGHIYMMASGIGVNKFWPLSLKWLIDEKVPCVERLRGEEWNSVEYVGTIDAKRIFAEVFAPWAKTQTKAYLYAEGQRRHIPLAAINRPDDLLRSAQLAQREYFVKMPHPDLAEPMVMPGAPYRLAATPWRMRGPAPRIGEHNAEVYGELGIDSSGLAALTSEGVI
jgi:benzylsuccinate CoA-transferase BbsE subunit